MERRGETPGRNGLRIEWTTSLDEVRRLRQPWLELQERVSRRTVYCDHDWIVAWYEVYSGTKYTDGGEALVGAAWDGRDLVGVAPLIRTRSRVARIPVRELLFAGFNLQAGEFIALDDRPEIPSEFLRSLERHGGWDLACFSGLQPEWEDVRRLHESARALRMPCEVTEDGPYATADLRDGYRPYIMKRSGHFRQNLKRYARKIEAAGGWKLDRLDSRADADVIDGYRRRILAIAQDGWRAQQRGLEEELNHFPFYDRVMQAFGSRGMLDVTILKIGAQDAAYCVGLVERHHYYHVLMGFLEALRGLSPGAFMLQEILKGFPEQKIVGMLSHGDYDYKRHWASEFVPQTRLLVFDRGWRGRLGHFAKFQLQPWISRLRQTRKPPPPIMAPGEVAEPHHP
jgi:CelD/BcsL family acetyltransferase involved in cellulose biosynthesis